MKKIIYFFAIAAMAFSACQKQPQLIPSTYVKSMNLTLQQSDYLLLPSTDYPHSTFTFDNTADANTYIPIILNARDPQLGNGSTANVTFTLSAPYLKVADTVYADVAYTLTKADYLLLPGNKYSDFSLSQVLSWLPYKYPNAVANQLAVLTFAYYNSPTTTTTTFSFLFLNGAWQQIYMVTPAEYASVGRSGYNQFTAADNANLIAYLNAILKSDAALSATATYGETQYVSFNYYNSGTYQRVIPLVFNGTNWVHTASITNTLNFIKSNGSWIPNPTVYYTLNANDIALIAASTVGTAAERANLGKYGDWETSWTIADIDSAIILVLTKDFPTPKVNVNYVVTYLLYTGGADVPTTATFVYNGTAWIPQQ
jgi:hypothetical protein